MRDLPLSPSLLFPPIADSVLRYFANGALLAPLIGATGKLNAHTALTLAEAALLAYCDEPGASAAWARAGALRSGLVHGRVQINQQLHWIERRDDWLLAFRGSEVGKAIDLAAWAEAAADWRNNFRLTPATFAARRAPPPGSMVHMGFGQAAADLWSELAAATQIATSAKPVYLCGHSLGGALASLSSLQLPEHRVAGVCTFGAPPAMNATLANAPHWAQLANLVIQADPVSTLPSVVTPYCHPGKTWHFNRQQALQPGPWQAAGLLDWVGNLLPLSARHHAPLHHVLLLRAHLGLPSPNF